MMRLSCTFCGSEFDARRSDAKFCGPQCKQKNHQAKSRQPVPPVQAVRSGGDPPLAEGLIATVEANLRAAGQLGTVAGQAALGLAEHLSRGAISGSERAALTKALHETMQRALAAASCAPDDPLEVIRRRVRAKRGQPLAGGDVPAETPAALVDFDIWRRTHPVPDDLFGATVGPVWDHHYQAWCVARRDWAVLEGWPGGESARVLAERECLERRPWDPSEI
jgi:hypothetical protein